MYVELHCHSNFSLLDGASHPEELVEQAAALGMPALALTDHDAVYGVPRFIQAAKRVGIKPLVGAELTFEDGHHLNLLVENQAGWHNLCYLISRGRHQAEKGKAALPFEELVGCTEGLIALSGCRRGHLAAALLANRRGAALQWARRYRRLFGDDHFYIELQHHQRPDDQFLVTRLVNLASYLQLPIVATNDVHYATQDRYQLQNVLVAIRHNQPLSAVHAQQYPNSEYYLKTAADLRPFFPREALTNTAVIAERCHFELAYGLQDLPIYPTPHGMSSGAYLRRLCLQALSQRYGDKGTETARTHLDHELNIIEQSGLANYFLIVWDIVRFAHEEGIRCQGRGSAAGSLVAYLLQISPIDPLAHGLVFERFLSAERSVTPDIDIDFDAARREEVIQYLYQRYGEAHTAMACTFVTFRRRSALRDVAGALDLSPETVAAATAHPDDATNSADQDNPQVTQLLALCEQIQGFPRHLGIHNGGMIITASPLMGRMPTEPATMAARTVVQWDKEGLEQAGLVKIDILGLRMLSAIDEAVRLVAEERGRQGKGVKGGQGEVLPRTFDDPAVYKMISAADTIGVFQVESRAQAQVLPHLHPTCFNDLIVSISLIRPGPVQGNMVHPYLRRRAGTELVSYAHPLLEPVLAETLGVILFQEQVIKVARVLADFTAGEGELLRRALGGKRPTQEVEQLRTRFVEGAAQQGVPLATAEGVFEQLLAFAGYSFAKSHAAAFAVLVYQSAWLKRYYPLHFYCALLNHQPMGFWSPAVLVGEVKRQGGQIWSVDIENSAAVCTVEGEGIRLGLCYVKGLKVEEIERIMTQRPFTDLAMFWKQTRVSRLSAERLILAGAFDHWGDDRRQLLWQLGQLPDQPDALPLTPSPNMIPLPPLTLPEALAAEQSVLGVTAGEHVLVFYRQQCEARGMVNSLTIGQVSHGRGATVAGLLVVHQAPPTAKGFHFLTLEDEGGMMNVVVRPQVYVQFRRVIRQERLLCVSGEVQQSGGVSNLLAERIWPLQLEGVAITATPSS